MIKKLVFKRDVVNSIITFCKMHHPNETILILRGNIGNDSIVVDSLIIPPLAEGGPFYSGFPSYMLPGDISILGTAHSHPSGGAEPSVIDVNHFTGVVGVIARYPYEENDFFAYNSKGEKLDFFVKD